MRHLNIIAVSAASVIVLFLLTELMGKRQMSQLSMFDYIIGITIGSIAAEMATALEGDFTKPLIAMWCMRCLRCCFPGCRKNRSHAAG
mgnify:CR=1 FL=1